MGNVINRLSILIVGHTVLVFLVLGAFMLFPETGPGDSDYAALNNCIRTHAATVLRCLKNDSVSNPAQIHSGEDCFQLTDEDLGKPLTQTMFKVTRGAYPQTIVEGSWVSSDTLATAPPDDGQRLVAFAGSHADGAVMHVLEESGAVQRLLVKLSDSATGGAYVYEVVLERSRPIIIGPHYRYARLLLFLASALVALLIALLLQKELGKPLERLRAQLRRSGEDTLPTPEAMPESSDEVVGDIIAGYQAYSHTISAQKREMAQSQAELTRKSTALHTSREFLEAILENAPNTVFVTDLSGEIVYCNAYGRREFLYGEGSPMPTDIAALIQPILGANQTSTSGHDEPHVDRVCVRSDGVTFPATIFQATLRDIDGVAERRLLVVRNISESERYKDMIARLDRQSLRGQMAGDIAHEINNFLAIIQGNVELAPLLLKKGANDRLLEKMDVIKSTVGRIATFADGLMRMESTEVSFSRDDINQLIHNLITFLAPQNRFDGIEFQLDLCQGPARVVEMDNAMMQQFFMNLFTNAADAMSCEAGGGRITVRTSPTSNSAGLQIVVQDGGPGVPLEYHEALFKERFSSKRRGLGIGLITCANVIRAHHGSLRYCGSHEGAIFMAEVPLVQPKEATDRVHDRGGIKNAETVS